MRCSTASPSVRDARTLYRPSASDLLHHRFIKKGRDRQYVVVGLTDRSVALREAREQGAPIRWPPSSAARSFWKSLTIPRERRGSGGGATNLISGSRGRNRSGRGSSRGRLDAAGDDPVRRSQHVDS